MTRTPTTLLGGWAVEVGVVRFLTGGCFELVVFALLLGAVVEIDGGILGTSAAQVLLVGPACEPPELFNLLVQLFFN